MLHLPHGTYYRDRNSEYELCNDFPADELFIDGLHAMQSHFNNNGIYIDIPVVRVMNTAHYIASYMFSNECSGDQMEYDVLAYDSFGRDKQLVPLTMIVLAAMLKRTEGFRAKQCRNVILDNRDPDFEEGVTLYDRFLRSAEKHFAEEEFLMDTHAQIQQLQAENTRLTSENIQLKYTITTMEEKYQQFNICTQNNIGTQIGTQIVYNIYGQTDSTARPQPEQAQEVTPAQEKPEPIDSIIFTKKAKKEAKEAAIIEALQNSMQRRKDKTRAFVAELHSWQRDGYVDAHFNAQVMYDELEKILPIPFGYEVFKKHYNNTRY